MTRVLIISTVIGYLYSYCFQTFNFLGHGNKYSLLPCKARESQIFVPEELLHSSYISPCEKLKIKNRVKGILVYKVELVFTCLVEFIRNRGLLDYVQFPLLRTTN